MLSICQYTVKLCHWKNLCCWWWAESVLDLQSESSLLCHICTESQVFLNRGLNLGTNWCNHGNLTYDSSVPQHMNTIHAENLFFHRAPEKIALDNNSYFPHSFEFIKLMAHLKNTGDIFTSLNWQKLILHMKTKVNCPTENEWLCLNSKTHSYLQAIKILQFTWPVQEHCAPASPLYIWPQCNMVL